MRTTSFFSPHSIYSHRIPSAKEKLIYQREIVFSKQCMYRQNQCVYTASRAETDEKMGITERLNIRDHQITV